MKLMTAAISKRLPKLYATNSVKTEDKVAIAKFFDPTGRGTWYITEFDGEDTMYGFVLSPLGPDCDEWGYISLSELQAVKGRMGLGIERDIHFEPTPMRALPHWSGGQFNGVSQGA